jgi:hypothetical protein
MRTWRSAVRQEKGPAIAGPFLIDATAVYLAA